MSMGYGAATGGTGLPGGGGGAGWMSSLGGLGGIGSLLGGVGAIGGLGLQVAGMLREDPTSKAARHKWQNVKPKAEELYNMLVYAPWMEGKKFPYSKTAYEYAPSQAMQAFYQNALTRSYGMPTGVAKAFSAQNMAQLRNPGLVSAMNPRQAFGALSVDPNKTAQTMMGQQQIGMLNQRSLMQSANRLAEYNLWRAGKVKELVG